MTCFFNGSIITIITRTINVCGKDDITSPVQPNILHSSTGTVLN